MNKNFLPLIEEYLFSDVTYKNNLDYQSKTNLYNNLNEVNISTNATKNHICQNIRLNLSQNKKNGASFPLDLINNRNKLNHEQNNNFTQKITLHSLNKIKNTDSMNQKENENNNTINNNNYTNNGIQHIILKTLKKNRKQFNRNNENNIRENNNNSKYNNNIIYNKNNIIRVIFSSQKIIQNFPMEYINEMVGDLCNNLFKVKYNLKLNNHFFEKRMSLFNFILRLCVNSSITEPTLFLTYTIFDIYISNNYTNNESLLLLIITSLVLAIKYMETTMPNLEDLCIICDKQFTKDDINKCELNIMQKLNYNISMPTIFDLYQFVKVIINMNEKEYNLGLFILEMFVISGRVLKYNPLIVVEAIFLLVQETEGKLLTNLNLYKYMVNDEINISEYNENINKCLSEIKNECLFVKKKNYHYLIKKFSNEKYQRISIDYQLL